MNVAYDLLKRIIDIEDADKRNDYFCIHCGCDMTPSALNSEKVSPYFKAKHSHDIDCEARIITNLGVRYNNKESEIDDVFERLMNLDSNDKKESPKKEPNGERNRKQKSYTKIKYLSQLVSFCVGNDIEKKVGSHQIKDFFVDKRTYVNFDKLIENKLYLFGLRYRRHSNDYKTMFFDYPIGSREKELGVWFDDRDVYNEIRRDIFDLKENGEYKDVYIFAKATKTNKLKIYSRNQFYFIKTGTLN